MRLDCTAIDPHAVSFLPFGQHAISCRGEFQSGVSWGRESHTAQVRLSDRTRMISRFTIHLLPAYPLISRRSVASRRFPVVST